MFGYLKEISHLDATDYINVILTAYFPLLFQRRKSSKSSPLNRRDGSVKVIQNLQFASFDH